MKLSDLIIEHGPYVGWQESPIQQHLSAAALNQLREELVAARCDRTRFEIGAVPTRDDEVHPDIRCGRCGWFVEFADAWPTLDELNQRAQEHAEVCS